MNITDYANGLLRDMAFAQSGVRFECVPCYVCSGTGLYFFQLMNGDEWQEQCRSCNGKGTVLAERAHG